MHAPLGPKEAVDQLRARLNRLPPTKGFLYLDGPSGAGKSRLLREFADATPGAVLIDAAGCTAEQIADRVMRAIGVPYEDNRSLFALYLRAEDQDLSHVVILTNTQWAGTTRHTDAPEEVAISGIVNAFGLKSGDTGIKFIVEIDSEVYGLSRRSYELGTWIGGILLLDGPTGRVLRQSRKNAVDGDRLGDPLAGTSLAQFTAMVCLQWKYMLAYHTSGGLDGDDLIEELKTWLAGIDPAAAATRNWGHVTETEEFDYLY
ncbi:ATP-binding protein [Streptomyces sp. NPDC056628]|uniref:ATP-binding protein n=1 Tax=Streptomyces sp. NPDC056628 TaxID=3345882 RepID=UPI003683E2E6